jgi:hypothetical protein
MTPLEAAKLAQSAYTDAPTYGDHDGAGRVVVYGAAVAFPGTDNICCWLADLDAMAVDVPGFGRVHCGFHDAWEEIAGPVLDLPVDTLIGHSEGAALAILASAAMCLAGNPPKVVFAFEPPRVTCDDTLARLFHSNGVELHLYRNGLDVVPDVPRMLEDWQHPGPLTLIGHASVPFPNVEDHLMTHVIAALTA